MESRLVRENKEIDLRPAVCEKCSFTHFLHENSTCAHLAQDGHDLNDACLFNFNFRLMLKFGRLGASDDAIGNSFCEPMDAVVSDSWRVNFEFH